MIAELQHWKAVALEVASSFLPSICCQVGSNVVCMLLCLLQCFTLPGYGRATRAGVNGQVVYAASVCPVGTFNIGGNTAGCQRCGVGLTTMQEGSNSTLQCSEQLGVASGFLQSEPAFHLSTQLHGASGLLLTHTGTAWM